MIRQKIAKVDARISELDSQFVAANKLEEWDASNVAWGELIKTISENIAERRDVYVVRLQMTNQNYQQRSRSHESKDEPKPPGAFSNCTGSGYGKSVVVSPAKWNRNPPVLTLISPPSFEWRSPTQSR